jgi:hypothetical protein
VQPVKVVVKQAIQVPYVGVVYRAGETVELPMPVAYQWLGSGWAVEAGIVRDPVMAPVANRCR